jgi:hypothetical protein
MIQNTVTDKTSTLARELAINTALTLFSHTSTYTSNLVSIDSVVNHPDSLLPLFF